MDPATVQEDSHATGYTAPQRTHDSSQGGIDAPHDESRSELPQSTYSTDAHIATAFSLPQDEDEQAERRIREALGQLVYRERQRLDKTNKSITRGENINGIDRAKQSQAESGELDDDLSDADCEQEADPVLTSTDSTPMSANIDAKERPVLPETWFRSEFKNRAAPWERRFAEADSIHNTGAFTMWGPNLEKRPGDPKEFATDSSKLDKFIAEGKRQQAGDPRKFAADSSRLDKFIAAEERKHVKLALKFDQLIRHGLAAGHPDHVEPILATPNCGPEEVVERKKAAEKLINQYVYESSGDEASDQTLSKRSGSKPKKNRFTKLKQALARLERPPGFVDDDEYAAQLQAETACLFAPALSKGDRLPTLGFQRAMWKDSNHPDFGMNFKEAVALAMAKEQRERIHAMPYDSSDPEDVDALPKYDIIAFTVANWVARAFKRDFRDERLVLLYNQVMQEQDPTRPFRSQVSLLEASRTEPREYFGKDLADPEEDEALAEGLKSVVARFIAVLKSDHSVV